jgi:hypothetical protein
VIWNTEVPRVLQSLDVDQRAKNAQPPPGALQVK